MAYSYSTNNSPATGAVAMYTLKELMKTAGWTVEASSDGSTYNSSGDQITSGSSGAGGMANASAWFRIRMPSTDGVTREFTFQRTSNTNWRIKYSQSAGFTGGSPGTTQTASATDEAILLGGGTDAAPTYAALFAADAGYRFNAICGGSAEGYTLYAFAFPNGGGTPTMHAFLERMAAGSFPASNIEPYVMKFANASPTVANTNSTTVGPKGWLAKGLAGQGFVFIPANTFTDNSGATQLALGPNSYTGIDDMLPILFGRRTALGAPSGYMGIASTLRMSSTTRTTGDTYTLSSTNDRIIIGDLAWPWDGSTPTI